MPVRPILRFPDPRLRRPAAPVTVFDDALRALADDLLDTMRAAPGVGITGPHVGALVRLVVLELPSEDRVRIYVNPHILRASDDRVRFVEGSVSMPGVSEEIERAGEVTVAYQTLDGTAAEDTATGFHAVCLQHEIDQLDGIFWIDRLSRLRRDRVVKRYEKLLRRS